MLSVVYAYVTNQPIMEPTRVKHLSGSPILGRPLALPINIGLGWKSLPGTNALAYYEKV